MEELEIRRAVEKDLPLILEFIRGLAEYEHMAGEVVATEELLREWLFERRAAEVIFAVLDGNFSTFLGRAGIYLEDLYVKEAYRGRGAGRALLRELARLALARGCGRLEWACLDWNRPSIDFYLSLGARPMSDWTTYRAAGETLKKLAE